MIYLFAGGDTEKKLAAYEKFLETLPGTEIFSVDRNSFNPAQLDALCSGTSLFSAKALVIFRDMLETEDMREQVLEKLPLMSESRNIFVFVERKLGAPILNAFKKAGIKGNQLNIFEPPKEKKNRFDSFRIAYTFAAKDKFNTWLCFRQAVEQGIALEELAGILFWKAKDMLLKKNFSIWKDEELKNFAARVSYLLPEARTHGPEAEAAFEQFLLEAF